MELLPIIETLLGQVSLDHWEATRDGKKIVLKEAHCGLRDLTNIWARFVVTERDGDHVIEGIRPVKGGVAVVTLDGVSSPGARLVLSKHIHLFPPRLRVVVTFELGSEKDAALYRFEATVTGV